MARPKLHRGQYFSSTCCFNVMSSRKEIAAHSTSATLKNLVEATIRNAENVG